MKRAIVIKRLMFGEYVLSSRERRELAKCKVGWESDRYDSLLEQERRGRRKFLYRKRLKVLTAMRLAKKQGIALEQVDMNRLPNPTLWDMCKAWWSVRGVQPKYDLYDVCLICGPFMGDFTIPEDYEHPVADDYE